MTHTTQPTQLVVADPDYRADPTRAVHVHGEINQALIDRLAPEIFRLQHESRQPITVYIDSPGGNVVHQASLLRLLKASNQDGQPACRIITVAFNSVASAAADLLSAGDYALAQPSTALLFHGVHTSLENITTEDSRRLTENLKFTNDQRAWNLVHHARNRFIFRHLCWRIKSTAPTAPDFLADIESRLSGTARRVFKRARTRNERYEALLKIAFSAYNRPRKDGTPEAKIEADVVKKLIDYEVRKHKDNPRWRLSGRGMEQVNEDLVLFNEYRKMSEHEAFKDWRDTWKRHGMTEAEQAELAAISDEAERDKRQYEIASSHILPLWSFFVALCHALQEEENRLTPEDAFWLGLIDEVVGVKGHLSSRDFIEYMAATKVEEQAQSPSQLPDSPTPEPLLPPPEKLSTGTG